ncbi:hypothetical protein LCGC14_0175430 [marine sediment metagenome]|uniref:Uncharacterized protein n=1 Tax=marine sediment metagenome TaxID=412755 RepID=A0A0F9UVA5_9ZZZZ
MQLVITLSTEAFTQDVNHNITASHTFRSWEKPFFTKTLKDQFFSIEEEIIEFLKTRDKIYKISAIQNVSVYSTVVLKTYEELDDPATNGLCDYVATYVFFAFDRSEKITPELLETIQQSSHYHERKVKLIIKNMEQFKERLLAEFPNKTKLTNKIY